MNGALGGNPTFGANYTPNGEQRKYFSAKKPSELKTPGPANIFVVLDEHPDSISDATYMLNGGLYDQTSEKWRDYPGNLHNNCVSISFADGHSEIHKWTDVRTYQTVQFKSFGTGGTPPLTKPINQTYSLIRSPDYEWLEDRMPYHF